jgi:hypothetical protein
MKDKRSIINISWFTVPMQGMSDPASARYTGQTQSAGVDIETVLFLVQWRLGEGELGTFGLIVAILRDGLGRAVTFPMTSDGSRWNSPMTDFSYLNMGSFPDTKPTIGTM